jgi:hypothetical protein
VKSWTVVENRSRQLEQSSRARAYATRSLSSVMRMLTGRVLPLGCPHRSHGRLETWAGMSQSEPESVLVRPVLTGCPERTSAASSSARARCSRSATRTTADTLHSRSRATARASSTTDDSTCTERIVFTHKDLPILVMSCVSARVSAALARKLAGFAEAKCSDLAATSIGGLPRDVVVVLEAHDLAAWMTFAKAPVRKSSACLLESLQRS